jgi:hypothetical protein
MSLNVIPAFGKSGTSRTPRRSSSAIRLDELVRDATLPHNGEWSREVVQPVDRQFGNAVHAGPGWSRSRDTRELLDGRLSPRRGNLHSAVAMVSNPSREPGTTRRFTHEPSEPDALNLPNDFEMNRRHPSSAAARPSQERRENRGENGGVGGLGRDGRNVNLAAPHTVR